MNHSISNTAQFGRNRADCPGRGRVDSPRRAAAQFNCRSLNHPIFTIGLFANRLALIGVFVMLAAQLLFT